MRGIPLTTTKPQITVAYLRSATADRLESRLSLVRQQDVCENFAHSLGVRITRIYFDVGVSGLREQRPALTQLMRDLSCGDIRRVVMADPGRLARDSRLARRLQERIRGRGASVSSPCDSRQLPTEGRNDDTPCD
jgi:DNA invertase Pin-like site-specific DNA recombinase